MLYPIVDDAFRNVATYRTFAIVQQCRRWLTLKFIVLWEIPTIYKTKRTISFRLVHFHKADEVQ